MTVLIGEVVAVEGVSITIKMFEDSNKDILFLSGEKYKGISIREHLLIQRGFVDIVCFVEGEYLDENKVEVDGNRIVYTRKVKVRPIGYLRNNRFFEGVKFLPMIKDTATLISEMQIALIYRRDGVHNLPIGKMLKEELTVFVPWNKLFNTHIGIFGNTGSGKSNTLAKLYTALFALKHTAIKSKSHFVLLDFNGEYIGTQFLSKGDKTVFNLSTRDELDKFPLNDEEFWDLDTLCLLFQATLSTQRPFLRRVIGGRKKFSTEPESLVNYTKSVFKSVFSSSAPKPECLELLRVVAEILGDANLGSELSRVSWHSKMSKFFYREEHIYFDSDGAAYETYLKPHIDRINADPSPFYELVVRSNIQLCKDLLHGFVQFEYIQPLLKRIDSSLPGLMRVLSVVKNERPAKPMTIVSLRSCNADIKKILPLLIAKHFYNQHKSQVANPPDNTLHIIIDEAHNILSEDSSRESESWKDHRLELFEEIIKEGRKFGVFMTVASQRPADISPTIVSQIHNFFIHRLVNERDLFLINNTISTLDRLSRDLIPTLPQGACVVTGTSFPLPMVVVVDLLEKNRQPDSEDVDLTKLWG